MKLEEIELPSNKKFGVFFSIIFTLVALYMHNTGQIILTAVAASVGAVFLGLAFCAPHLLHSLNKLWMRFGFLLGKIISPIVLGAVFFGIFTPIAVTSKIFGRDELLLRRREKHSFWIRRENSSEIRKSFKNQF